MPFLLSCFLKFPTLIFFKKYKYKYKQNVGYDALYLGSYHDEARQRALHEAADPHADERARYLAAEAALEDKLRKAAMRERRKRKREARAADGAVGGDFEAGDDERDSDESDPDADDAQVIGATSAAPTDEQIEKALLQKRKEALLKKLNKK